jgi:hypothetical protein
VDLGHINKAMPIDDSHPIVSIPTSNISLWRYMDIPSFLSLLINQSLVFVRADLFEDKYEGILPKMTAAMIDRHIRKPQNYSKLLNESRIETYLNCWCNESHEVVHMWKIYSKEKGVAIKTDYEALKSSILSTETIYPTLVRYIDFENEIVDWKSSGLTVYTLKRREYKSEKEFRLILPFPRLVMDQLLTMGDPTEHQRLKVKLFLDTDVISCRVNIDTLIKHIHVSPYAPKWYKPLISGLASKYGLQGVPVSQSDL